MAEPGNSRLRVAVTDGRGRAVRAPGLAAWLVRIAPRSASGDVSIALVSDPVMRRMNRDHRDADYATDVLSFEAWPDAERPIDSGAPVLGDIAIATGVARRQAREAGHSYATELKVLALHGLLHLLGYDHESPADRGAMARVERRLRRKGGLVSGLIERARP